MLTIRLRLCLTLVLTAVVTEGKQFRSDYTYYPEVEGWIKIHVVPANWHDARLQCALEGAVLASPVNDKYFSFLKEVIFNKIHCAIYTGIHATQSKGVYTSIKGVPLSKMPIVWAPNEPDNCNDSENCLIMYTSGTIADVNCKDVFPYVCYKKDAHEVVGACGTIDKEYHLEPRTGSCYKFHRRTQTWPMAFKTCAAEGGYLTIINNEVESQVIKEIYAKYPDNVIFKSQYPGMLFIGFHDWDVRGSWWTIHGDTLKGAGFENWDISQPDNATTGEFCGSIFRSGFYNDAWCHVFLPFICEKSPNSISYND